MKKKSLAKRIIRIVVLVLVVAVIGGMVYSYNATQKALKELANLQLLQTRQVARGDIERTVSASGNVASGNVTDLVIDWTGKAQEVNFEAGDLITEGDLLAVVVNEDLDDQIKTANNTVRQQQINLEKQKDTLTSSIVAPESGRIKEMKAQLGENATTTAGTYGQICWISPDNKMTMTFTPEYVLKMGDMVRCETENGVEYDAEVVNVAGQQVTIDIFDDLYLQVGDYVTVKHRDGMKYGAGTISIKNGVKVTGSGKITDILVQENQFVSRGEDMFMLDNASAQLSYESSSISVSDARLKLSSLKKDADKGDVLSPVSGVISALTLKEGVNVTTGTTVATIQDLDNLQTVVNVDELDIDKVEVGQKVYITIEALDDAVFEGEVIKIASIGANANGFASYPVTISLSNPGNIKIAMSCEVEIMVDTAPNVLMLAVEDLSRDAEGYYVNVVTDGLKEDGTPIADIVEIPAAAADMMSMMYGSGSSGPTIGVPAESLTTEKRRVEVGLINETYAEIVSGLEEGDVIAVSPNNNSGMMMVGGGGGAGATVTVVEYESEGGGPRGGGGGGGRP